MKWLWAVGSILLALPHATCGARDTEALTDDVTTLCRRYVASFGSDATELVYHHRLDGPLGVRALADPAEIRAGTVRGKPLPYGYGSGIQDVALENGQFLFALCEVYDATGDPQISNLAKSVFRGLRRVATVSSEPGFVPRGPHPDGKSYYRDSSRDQHAAMAEALWRYGCSGLASVDDRRFIAGELGEMARRMEANDWKILVEDGSRVAHVGFGWKQATPVGAISLLSFLAMVADATGDPHWQKAYQEFSDEKDSFRWRELLNPNRVEHWKPFTLYSNQFAQALLALRRVETDPGRKRQIAELQRRLARRALESNVFDSASWRRLDWAGAETDDVARMRLAPLGISLSQRHDVRQLFEAYDPAWMQSEDPALRSAGNKLCFGIPTSAFHKALTAEDRDLVAQVATPVRRMVHTMLQHGRSYQGGENYNRTVVLGLLLWAAEADSAAAAHSDLQTAPLSRLGIGPSMDVDVDGGILYAIGDGRLRVVDVTRPKSPVVKGTVGGLGHVRQICVHRGVAYVTAREDGLFLIDVSAPRKPRIIAHYDTIELATGIAVSGEVAFVACRTAGVELVDVSSPERPVHISTVRTGEAQSVCARNGRLFVGVWAAAELVICDVSNPHSPAILSRTRLQGYGDGVDVQDDYCFVATGHHAKGRPHAKPDDPGYGQGHGLEIFQVSDPRKPKFVSRVSFPPFYRLGMDMWEVKVADRYALVADTYNGVFAVDISEPNRPRVVAHRGLPFVASRNDPSPAAGVALGSGTVFVAGAWSDVHALPWDTSRAHQKTDQEKLLVAGPRLEPKPDPRFRAYRPGGQVHAVDCDGRVVFAACGNAGLHALDILPRIRVRAIYATRGFALGVAVAGRRVYVAEGDGGLSIWQHDGTGRLKLLGRYRSAGDSVRQVVVVHDKWALLHVGAARLQIVDVSDPRHPVRVLQDSRLGLFYYNPLARGLLGGRLACCHWHVSGLYWYDLDAEKPRWTGQQYPFRIGSRNGVAFLDTRALITCRGGYALISPDERRPPDELDLFGLPGTAIYGKPAVSGTRLFVSDRNTGIVTGIDISDPEHPRLIDRLALAEHPGLVMVHGGVPVVPAGYQGLLVWDSAGSRESGD